jgi:hypothetical protein
MEKKQEKQLWMNVEKQIKKFYGEMYDETDLKIAKAFFKAGFNVYPESGYMFQKITNYEDGSYNEACVDIEEARVIFKELKQEGGNSFQP